MDAAEFEEQWALRLLCKVLSLMSPAQDRWTMVVEKVLPLNLEADDMDAGRATLLVEGRRVDERLLRPGFRELEYRIHA